MRLKELCPKPNCGAPAILVGESNLGSLTMFRLKCGHVFVKSEIEHAGDEQAITVSDTSITSDGETVSFDDLARFDDDGNVLEYPSLDPSFYSLDGSMRGYDFQIDGVHFAEKTKLQCLIADEMGLGKTVQALIAMKRNRMKTLILVKGSIMFQWAKQAKVWFDNHPLRIMPVMDRSGIIPGFDVYIISIDFISRKGVLDRLNKLGIQLIIVDECQNFKDSSSKRTKALIDLIEQSKIKHRIFLSGTPIKNRANEYFVILNLLDPARFHSYVNFCRTWLIPNEKGIYTRLDPELIEKFREVTSRYIIRREVKDVQKNLPALTRDWQWFQIEDPIIKNSYNKELDFFDNFLRSASTINSTTLLGWLARMRAITGQAKIPWAIEYTQQFLEQTDKALLLGIHHHSVRDILFMKFDAEGYKPLKFSGEDNQWAKERAKTAFINGENRLMIMNMIAGGTGTDGLQKVCHSAVVLERQWSSADEEQFEKRLSRDGQAYPVNVVYPIAEGTIDQWFYDLVEEKRKIVRETLGDSEALSYDPSSDSSLLQDLAEMTVRHRL